MIENSQKITLSVHELIDFVYHTGNIDNRVFNTETMSRGSQIHAFYQAKQNESYQAEVYFEHTFDYEDKEVTIQGRADGVISNGSDITIEEIKSTNAPLDLFYEENEIWHLSQAKVYAFIYALKYQKDEMRVLLTYISQKDDSKKKYEYIFSKDELIAFINETLEAYFSFFVPLENHQSLRGLSAAGLTFPFGKLRSGQVSLMASISEHLTRKDRLFINAPTGSGKTIATLYPSVKEFSKKTNSRIFYLTAKTSGQQQTIDTMATLNNAGLVSKSIVLSSKEKMCINDKISCNPDECPFARGYFGKVKDALRDIFPSYSIFTPEIIKEYARKHQICPFEFQLELSLLNDVIIGDYNYLFDPFVYLRRFFDNKLGEYTLLVDEAHNLGRRVNDNYSYTLDFNLLYPLRKVLKGAEHKKSRLIVNKIAKFLESYEDELFEEITLITSLPPALHKLLDTLLTEGSLYMQERGALTPSAFKDFYFAVNRYLKLNELKNEDFKMYVQKDNEGEKFLTFSLRSFNPAPFIEGALKTIDHAFFFSATLSPLPLYEKQLAIGDYEVKQIESPFDKENLLVLVDQTVSLLYKDRDFTLSEVADKIYTAINYRKGNYIVYAPSFLYLEKLISFFYNDPNLTLVIQKRIMNESDRENFLNSFVFDPQQTTLGFAVIGGSFSEGVDLVSDRLSGVIILGVGFPALTFDKDLEKEFYDSSFGDGFLYSYVYPGLNKVLQTMGRVIRSEEDQGFVLLLDKRYGQNPYRDYIKNYHANVVSVRTKEEIGQQLSLFYAPYGS